MTASCTCFVDITVGPAHHVEVSALKEAVDDIKIEVEDGVLNLESFPSSTKCAREPARFEITQPQRRSVAAFKRTVALCEQQRCADLNPASEAESITPAEI